MILANCNPLARRCNGKCLDTVFQKVIYQKIKTSLSSFLAFNSCCRIFFIVGKQVRVAANGPGPTFSLKAFSEKRAARKAI